MTARILDGEKVAKAIRQEVEDEVRALGRPCLGVILCTDDPASQIYVQKKRDACEQVGITSVIMRPFEGGVNKWEKPLHHLIETIHYMNMDDAFNGILVQLPLPSVIDQYTIFGEISPMKDVDVFHPENVGLLVQGRPRFLPCTPQGIHEMLVRHGVRIYGRKVCIINRSDVVGKPLHSMLIQNDDQANATVTLCHDRTPPYLLKEVCLSSDIIVVAVGKPGFLTADMVAPNTVVVDVGITRIPGSKKIVGDVDFEAVKEKASWISPVPKGCGPVTVACLLRNVLKAYKLQTQK